jgi:hypothetical protein
VSHLRKLDFQVLYLVSNGDRSGPLDGHPAPSSESSEVRWVPAAEAVGYAMDRSMRIRISDFLTRRPPVVT